MVAPAGAAATASLTVRKCVASGAGPSSSTKRVASAGGKVAAQSPSGAQVVEPRRSRVPGPQAAGGSTASQPHPEALAVKPAGHWVHPTGTQSGAPSAGMVPGPQVAARTSTQPGPPGSGRKPSVQTLLGTHAPPSMARWPSGQAGSGVVTTGAGQAARSAVRQGTQTRRSDGMRGSIAHAAAPLHVSGRSPRWPDSGTQCTAPSAGTASPAACRRSPRRSDSTRGKPRGRPDSRTVVDPAAVDRAQAIGRRTTAESGGSRASFGRPVGMRRAVSPQLQRACSPVRTSPERAPPCP